MPSLGFQWAVAARTALTATADWRIARRVVWVWAFDCTRPPFNSSARRANHIRTLLAVPAQLKPVADLEEWRGARSQTAAKSYRSERLISISGPLLHPELPE